MTLRIIPTGWQREDSPIGVASFKNFDQLVLPNIIRAKLPIFPLLRLAESFTVIYGKLRRIKCHCLNAPLAAIIVKIFFLGMCVCIWVCVYVCLCVSVSACASVCGCVFVCEGECGCVWRGKPEIPGIVFRL